ncbi:multidrug effflux MFS transporter [Aquicella lusitana]|uniref:Bcr/CflA family efflux transporter n=1 Tax=Aquicella lusitana TaxID=254246 RepID=A0A370GLL9_9COXI|nr:multidrug effflux MFS transporter [Aquicella lusitana]RDI44547.1 Bcr/CflA subfamily drug resistance transporter [Aquicella lusitana]VVC72511.1 Bicyclomycin resistance protein [Aquicella lusitana]
MDNVRMQSLSERRKILLAVIVLLTIPISGLSVDIYVPSLPAVTDYFDIHKSLAQLTITTYILGFGFMQFFSGSISDSLGRKKPLMLSLLIYIAASIWSAHADTVYHLLILRFIQGIAVAGISVSMRAVLSDIFEGQALYKMINYMTISWSIGPIIAPAIGGYLQHYFGWQSTFYFLTIYGVIMFLLNFMYMPETIKITHPFHILNILARYKHILFHIDYFIGMICLGLLYSMIILFGIVAPFLIQDVLRYSAVDFGHIALLMGLAWFLGNMTNRFLIAIPIDKKVKTCFWLMLITTFVMFLLAMEGPFIYFIIIPTFVLLYLGGLVFPNFYAKNLALFPEAAATANALMSAFMVLIASGTSAVGTLLKANTQMPLTLAYMAITLIALLAYYLSVYHHHKKG